MKCSGHTSLDFILLLIDHLVSLIPEALTLLASMFKVCFGQRQLPVVFGIAHLTWSKHRFAAWTPSGFKALMNEKKSKAKGLPGWQIIPGAKGQLDPSFQTTFLSSAVAFPSALSCFLKLLCVHMLSHIHSFASFLMVLRCLTCSDALSLSISCILVLSLFSYSHIATQLCTGMYPVLFWWLERGDQVVCV